ncbi:MAG: DUF2889 domain-containing protein [Myxococcota bacterium]
MRLPTRGHPLHTRSLTITATHGHEGCWHARGDVIDLRKCSFVPMSYDIQPAGIVHQMNIDLRVDPSTRRIESIDVGQPTVAVEPSEASRGECCRDPAPRLQQMVGEKIDSAFPKSLSRVFGGPLGCSHLVTLFQLMGSALRRALELEAALASELGVARKVGERIFRRAAFIDGFEIDAASIGVGIQLADFLTRPSAAVTQPLERLARQNDARCYAVIARETLAIVELRAAIRERTAATLGDASWETLDEEVGEFIGSAIMARLAAKLLGRYGDTPERFLLLDCLLQLAPGYVQVMAALMEKWFETSSGSGFKLSDSDGEPGAGAVGGTADSCYIWRSGGPMSDGRGSQ